MYSVKDYMSVRTAWCNSRPAKGSGKGSPPPPPPGPKASCRGPGRGGLTTESLQKQSEDMCVVDWSVVNAKCKRTGAADQP